MPGEIERKTFCMNCKNSLVGKVSFLILKKKQNVAILDPGNIWGNCCISSCAATLLGKREYNRIFNFFCDTKNGNLYQDEEKKYRIFLEKYTS